MNVSPSAPLPPAKPRSPRLLVLDPGHGGHDPGALGLTDGTFEKNIVLDIARRVASALEDTPGVKVHLTRTEDLFLPLPERVALAQHLNADLFLSLHADSAPNSAARGLSTYVLSPHASDKLAGQIAARENVAGLTGPEDLNVDDPDVAAILFDLTTRRTRDVARRAQAGLVRLVGRKWPLLENPTRSANFAVLRSPEIPSVLVETGFLSNPHDEALLRQADQRQKIATLIAKSATSLLRSPLFG